MELKKGSRGEEVRKAQIKLNSLGFNVGLADGIFGPATETGVKNFQQSKGIPVTGIIDFQTLQTLNAKSPVTLGREVAGNPIMNKITDTLNKVKENKPLMIGLTAGVAGLAIFMVIKAKK